MTTKRIYMSWEDKVLLKKLISQFQDKVDTKKSDSISRVERMKAWTVITKQFNSMSKNPAKTVIQLKKCWDNLRNKQKRIELSKKEEQNLLTDEKPYTSPLNVFENVLSNVDIEIKKTSSDTVTKNNKNLPYSSDEKISTNIICKEKCLRCHAKEIKFDLKLKKLEASKNQEFEMHNLKIQQETMLHLQKMKNEEELHKIKMKIQETKLKIAEKHLELLLRK